ncbi:hypothetical protein [Sulfurimonas sp.]|uniref:hypothetical protein n=1 Tax=Sulfurimonas sp. TaxID=2022749 RepID=UPI002600BF3F|nr:hypothetical protein [Sulfurimonas sp.]MBT5935618.1 hypothetical protein [Sulfurimonas sp.]
MHKFVLHLFISVLFIGCGSGTEQSDSNVNIQVPVASFNDNAINMPNLPPDSQAIPTQDLKTILE